MLVVVSDPDRGRAVFSKVFKHLAIHWLREHDVPLLFGRSLQELVVSSGRPKRDGHAREQLSFVDYLNATSSDSMYDMQKSPAP
jgi:hypothetical protein